MSSFKIQATDNHTLIKCKSCLQQTSISANSCPNCADIDPFGLKTIQELGEKKKSKESMYALVVGLSLIIGYNSTWWIGLIIFVVLGMILKYVIDEYFSKHYSYYYIIRDKVKSNNTIQSFDVWDKYAKEILKKYD